MTTLLRRSKWQIWKDVIFSLMVRQVRTSFADKFGLSWAIIQPVSFIFILSFIRGRLDGGETYSMPTFVFMAYGLVIIQLFLQVFQSSSNGIKRSKPLFAFRQVQPISPVIAAGLFEGVVKLFVILCMAVIMYFLSIELRLDDPLLVILNLFSLCLFSMSLGLICGLVSAFIPEMDKVFSLLTRPLFFISGVFFSLRDFPPEIWWALDWNPILHAIELSRGAAYSSYNEVGVSQAYVIEVTMVTTFIALVFYRATWKRALGQ
ncbi:ABC transporter permease [Glaciecola siphonariae]|uniref:Transport permease protein n=1 Tax=Glaciecola siphonariae TaxID=521012 RepID=A0ABV9LVL9_9ALTE